IAKIVGLGALKYNDLSQNRMSDITFDWERMLSLEGNSAPYLQYTYARFRSILRKAPKSLILKRGFDPAALNKEADLGLVLKLAYFPEIIKSVTVNYYPHYLANYLYELTRLMNSFYEKEPVLKSEPALREARLALVKKTAETLKVGLDLLGIKTIEKI
ncbi:MAG TPA: DALR anticodon-binding domain-containing protein, partial [Candidatus Paceibacterota bacterium]